MLLLHCNTFFHARNDYAYITLDIIFADIHWTSEPSLIFFFKFKTGALFKANYFYYAVL